MSCWYTQSTTVHQICLSMDTPCTCHVDIPSLLLSTRCVYPWLHCVHVMLIYSVYYCPPDVSICGYTVYIWCWYITSTRCVYPWIHCLYMMLICYVHQMGLSVDTLFIYDADILRPPDGPVRGYTVYIWCWYITSTRWVCPNVLPVGLAHQVEPWKESPVASGSVCPLLLRRLPTHRFSSAMNLPLD